MIDETKLIEEINKKLETTSISLQTAEIILNIIKSQPKVGEWILAEDRLPNEEEFEKYYCRNHYAAEFIVMIKGANKPTSLYYKEGVWFDDNNNDYDVIAWQPLPEFPEPYSSGTRKNSKGERK